MIVRWYMLLNLKKRQYNSGYTPHRLMYILMDLENRAQGGPFRKKN